LNIGYDPSLEAGYIQPVKTGVAWEPLLLNPIGGNVGIGTTSASYPLDVWGAQGDARIESSTGTNDTYLDFTNTSGNMYVGLDTSSGGGLSVGSSAYAGVINVSGAHPLQFGTNNNVAMTILSGGNVGIGTASPDSPLESYTSASSINAIHGYATASSSNGVYGVGGSGGYGGYFTGGTGVYGSSSAGYGVEGATGSSSYAGVIGVYGGEEGLLAYGGWEFYGNGGSYGLDVNVSSATAQFLDGSWGIYSTGEPNGLYVSATSGYYTELDTSSWGVVTNGNIDAGACITVNWSGYCGYQLNVNGSTYFNGNTATNGIMYDAANTGYYVQPSEVTVLNTLDVAANVYSNMYGYDCAQCAFSGGLYEYIQIWSDRRLKTDIQDFLDSSANLDRLMQLKPVRFHWKDAKDDKKFGEQIGFIAQDVEKIYPELVGDGGDNRIITDKDGTKETIEHPMLLKYEKFVVPAILAIQSLKTADDKRDEEIAALKADEKKQLAALKAANDNLRALIAAEGREIGEFEAYKKAHP
jgi:hypothetical protein